MVNGIKTLSPRVLVATLCVSLAGCTTISDWFADDEELEIRRLEPIESRFEAQEVWSHTIDSGVEGYFSRLRPVVGYDLVFVAGRQGTVAAFEPDSGERVWEVNFAEFPDEGYFSFLANLWSDGISAKISGGLAVAYETVYFGTEDGEVFALEAKTGELKWRTSVKGEVLAAPAVDENVVVVNTGGGVMFALDAETGEEKWKYDSEVPALSLRGVSGPTTAGGGAIIGTANGKVAVALLESGQIAWEQTVATPSGATELDRIVDIDGQPLVVAGVIHVISYDGTLAAVELRSGRVIWKREYRSFRRLTLSGNTLYAVDNNSNVYSLDRRNGIEKWSQGGLKRRNLTAATPIGDYLVVGDRYGFLHWLDQEDGTIVSRMDIGGDDEDEGIYAAPVAEGNVLYTQTRSGEFIAIQMPEGS